MKRIVQVKYIESNINKGMKKLAPADREKIRVEEQRQNKIDNAKRDLWKFRGKEKKRKKENTINKVGKLGKKAKMVAQLLEQEREKKEIENKIN